MGKQNNDLTLKVGFDIDKFQGEINKTTGVLNKWAAGVQNSVMGVAAGFSVLALGEFALDISKIAGEAEGVRVAFEKLPNSIRLMHELKQATAGTVSELELMKRSVMAANFGINLEALPKLLEFAAVRAKQTGQSVSFLADSIVTGIGRKSALILDNLGISLSAINEELKVTPDYAQAVGNIAERELSKMGTVSENAATQLERMNASLINAKVAMGGALNGTGLLGKSLEVMTNTFDVFASKHLNWVEKVLALQGNVMGIQAAKQLAMARETKELTEAMKEQARITDTATVLLRDLGLDYQALSNVAGDNKDVTAIWNEMQRLAAERTEKVTEEVTKQATAVKDLSRALFEQSEIERAARIASLDRSQAGPSLSPMDALGKFTSVNIPDLVPQFDTEKITKDLDKVATMWQEYGDIASHAIESVIIADENMGKSMANITRQILSGSKVRIANYLGEGIAKAFSINPIAGAAIASVSLGAILGLMGKVGAKSNGGGSGGGASSTSMGSRSENIGQRIQLQVDFTGEAGKILKAQMIKQDRVDSRTRA